jgi:hypothetical protein
MDGVEPGAKARLDQTGRRPGRDRFQSATELLGPALSGPIWPEQDGPFAHKNGGLAE